MKKSYFVRRFFELLSFSLCVACSNLRVEDGPGMILTFNSNIQGRDIIFVEASSSSGSMFAHPGFLAPNLHKKDPMEGGATMGGAPDGRKLPEWVEFVWRESITGEKYSREQWLSLPLHRARILIRSHVPQEVVDELMESKRKREHGKLPEKSLWLYFIWRENEIQFRWKLMSGCCEILRAGGDE